MSFEEINGQIRAKFSLNGLNYIFEPSEEGEGPILVYVGDERGRLVPSQHAIPEAWEIANKMLEKEAE